MLRCGISASDGELHARSSFRYYKQVKISDMNKISVKIILITFCITQLHFIKINSSLVSLLFMRSVLAVIYSRNI